jgi:predicted RNase H-like HicB family nuclease
MSVREFNINVVCRWDADAKVWSAASTNLPGLVTEAATVPEIIQRVMEIAPELIEDNLIVGKVGEDYLLNVVPVYQQMVRVTAH